MTHDPLCPMEVELRALETWETDHLPEGVICQCDLVAKVRADERERVLAEGPYFTSVVHDCCVKLQEMNAKPLPLPQHICQWDGTVATRRDCTCAEQWHVHGDPDCRCCSPYLPGCDGRMGP